MLFELMSVVALLLIVGPSAGSQQKEADSAPSGVETTQEARPAVDEDGQEHEDLEEAAPPPPPPPEGLLPVVELARFEHAPRDRPHVFIARDFLVVVTRKGLTHGIDVATGELKWKLGLPSEELYPPVVLPSLESFSLLLSTPSGRLFFLDGRTGRIVSEKQLPFPLALAPFVSETSVLYSGTREGVIHGFDLKSDSEIFATATGEPPSAFSSSSDLLTVSGARQTFTALDPLTGAVKWTLVGRGPFLTPATFGDDRTRLYIGSDTGEFYCLDALNGKVKFKWATGASIRSPALVEGDRVYVSTYGNAVYAYGARNGHEQWRTHLPGRPASGPIRLYQRFMVATKDGVLIEIDPTRGELKKSHTMSGEILDSPAFHIVPAPPITDVLEEPEGLPAELLLLDPDFPNEYTEEPKWYDLSRIAVALRSGQVLLLQHMPPEPAEPEDLLDPESNESLTSEQTSTNTPAASPPL